MKKKQTSVYLTSEDEKRIRDLQALYLLTGKRYTMNQLFINMLHALHDQEFKK